MLTQQEENPFGMLFRTIDALHKERLLKIGVRHSVPAAVRHAYTAREMGCCPRKPDRPWHRCLQGALAFIRMHSRMAERLGTPDAIDLLTELDSWYQELLDVQEMS